MVDFKTRVSFYALNYFFVPPRPCQRNVKLNLAVRAILLIVLINRLGLFL